MAYNSIHPYGRYEADGVTYDKEWIRQLLTTSWGPMLDAGRQPLFIGEFGTHNCTPHDVTLAWLRDELDIFSELHLGWTLWNLRGSFGVLDSGRTDVDYEDFHGHKLDRQMSTSCRAISPNSSRGRMENPTE